MHSRFFSKLTALRLALIVIATFVAFGTVQLTALAKSSSCPSASAPCVSQPEPGQSDGLSVGRSTLKGLPGLAGPDILASGLNTFYAGSTQFVTADGVVGYFEHYEPKISLGSFASSGAALVAASADGKQAVEVGWEVSPVNHGDFLAHLFVGVWINGTASFDSGFQQVSSDIYPGDFVPVDGKMYSYAIDFFNGNWWVWYKSEWFGYFPGTDWNTVSGKFTHVSLAQWYGVVWQPQVEKYPCAQMGNGSFGQSNGSAVITTMSLFINGKQVSAHAQTYQSTPNYYDTGHSTGNSFTYGGPGDTNPKDCP